MMKTGTPAIRVSIADRLFEFSGVGPGFDHARIGLALCILLWHSFSNSYGINYARELPVFPVPPLLSALLPMFFGLSGFLVMGSAIRTADLRTFIAFRTLRIVPALFTEIAVSAFVLGPLLTTLPLKQYFTDPLFFQYLGSIIGRVRFVLPGLFAENPIPDYVNFALWTVGPEILCYVAMSLIMLIGAYSRPSAMLKITLLYGIFSLSLDVIFPPERVAEVLPAKLLIFSFLVGATIYQFRTKITYSKVGAASAFSLATILVFLSQSFGTLSLCYLSIPGYVYTIVVIGLTQLPRIPLLQSGDYSYGIYIYGFPLQQSIAYFLPHHREWWVNFAIALPIVLFMAICSWHLIEKPFLRLREKKILRSTATYRLSQRWAFAAISIYGLFLIDANSTFPVRSVAKATLSAVGLYQQPK